MYIFCFYITTVEVLQKFVEAGLNSVNSKTIHPWLPVIWWGSYKDVEKVSSLTRPFSLSQKIWNVMTFGSKEILIIK